jgi:hypothetical protein
MWKRESVIDGNGIESPGNSVELVDSELDLN